MATLEEDEIDVIDDEHLNALLSFSPDVQQAIEQVSCGCICIFMSLVCEKIF